MLPPLDVRRRPAEETLSVVVVESTGWGRAEAQPREKEGGHLADGDATSRMKREGGMIVAVKAVRRRRINRLMDAWLMMLDVSSFVGAMVSGEATHAASSYR